MSSYQNLTIVCCEESSNQRLDKFLASAYPDKSRNFFANLIKQNKVTINGIVPTKSSCLVKSGDVINISYTVSTIEENAPQPENIPLSILYEDEYILAIDKPPNMVVHPAVGNWSSTVVNAILFYCQDLEQESFKEDPARPGIIHRLDKDTSGVLLIAKTDDVKRKICKSFADREVEKEYLAISIGNPGDKEINTNIGRNPRNRKEMSVVLSGGKPSLSFCKTLVFSKEHNLSLVQLFPKTGRTHQLRVHLNFIKCPVLGDLIYGLQHINRKYNTTRQLLHAHKITFTHPITAKTITITSDIPNDMQQFTSLIGYNNTAQKELLH